MLTDEEIIKLYFARDEQAIPATSDKYGSGCFGIARNILSDRRDAEESVNDTWLAAWNTIPPQRPDPLRTFLYKLVRNLSLDRYRRNTAQKRSSSYDIALDELEGCLPSNSRAEEGVEVRELTALLNRFLEKLDRNNRVLFVRRYWYGDSVSDLSVLYGMKPNAVTVRLKRLREKLRKELEKEGYRV